MKKVLIGTVEIERDVEMFNNQFGYAASFEQLKVDKGVYPIYAYEGDLKREGGKIHLGWRNYIGYEGTVIAGNVGGKPGEHTRYDLMVYEYMLAEHFLKGHSFCDQVVQLNYELRPEWGLNLGDYISSYDQKRHFYTEVVLKDGAEFTYMEER